MFMEPDFSANEARKFRRKLLNERNSGKASQPALSKAEVRRAAKDALIDLSKKDNRSGRGRYI